VHLSDKERDCFENVFFLVRQEEDVVWLKNV